MPGLSLGCKSHHGGRREGRNVERSILDLHAVRGKFGKAVRKSLIHNQPLEDSRVSPKGVFSVIGGELPMGSMVVGQK